MTAGEMWEMLPSMKCVRGGEREEAEARSVSYYCSSVNGTFVYFGKEYVH